ncbi:MAG: hypothetical protein ABEI99_01250, partial [Halobaculum sp.]
QRGTAERLLEALDPRRSTKRTTLETRLAEGIDKLAEYDRLDYELSNGTPAEVDGDLASTVADQLAQRDEEIGRQRDEIETATAELERLRPKGEAFDTVADRLDTPWLRDRVAGENEAPESLLPRAAEQGLVGPTVIEHAAANTSGKGTKSGTELLGVLEDPDPDRVRAQLDETVERLERHDEVAGSDELADRTESLRHRLDDASIPLAGLRQLLDEYDDRAGTAVSDLEKYSLAEGLGLIEDVLDEVGELELDGEWADLIAERDRLADEVDGLRQPGEYEIRTGHQVTGVFTEVAEQLTDRARQAYDDDEPERARASVEAAEQVCRGVKEVYTTRRLRRILQ